MTQLEELHPYVSLSVVNPKSNEKAVFGSGIAKLCLGVRSTGSLSSAAKRMGMAYSKAWTIMNGAEDALGFKLIEREGSRGSSLTPQGDKLLDIYIELNRTAQAFCEKEYIKIFEKQKK